MAEATLWGTSFSVYFDVDGQRGCAPSYKDAAAVLKSKGYKYAAGTAHVGGEVWRKADAVPVAPSAPSAEAQAKRPGAEYDRSLFESSPGAAFRRMDNQIEGWRAECERMANERLAVHRLLDGVGEGEELTDNRPLIQKVRALQGLVELERKHRAIDVKNVGEFHQKENRALQVQLDQVQTELKASQSDVLRLVRQQAEVDALKGGGQ